MSHEHPHYNALLTGEDPIPKGNNGVFFTPRSSPGVQTLLKPLLHRNRRIIKATELCPQETATVQAMMYKYFLHNPGPIDDIP